MSVTHNTKHLNTGRPPGQNADATSCNRTVVYGWYLQKDEKGASIFPDTKDAARNEAISVK